MRKDSDSALRGQPAGLPNGDSNGLSNRPSDPAGGALSSVARLPGREAFEMPEGVIYLDGNSLGPLPRVARERVARAVAEEWGGMLIRGWTQAGWIDLPARVGDRIGRLVGAAPGTVMACDSTSVNLYKALSAALALRQERRIVLSDNGNFPTDLYVAQGLLAGTGCELRIVPPEEVAAAIDDGTAVLMLTQVDYRTGRLHDMADLTRRAHAAGALTVWDLAHSAGALPVDLTAAGADFAVGCGYKYLNGGPGAPAFVYVAPRHAEAVSPRLSGWATPRLSSSTRATARPPASSGCASARRPSCR